MVGKCQKIPEKGDNNTFSHFRNFAHGQKRAANDNGGALENLSRMKDILNI